MIVVAVIALLFGSLEMVRLRKLSAMYRWRAQTCRAYADTYAYREARSRLAFESYSQTFSTTNQTHVAEAAFEESWQTFASLKSEFELDATAAAYYREWQIRYARLARCPWEPIPGTPVPNAVPGLTPPSEPAFDGLGFDVSGP